MFAVGCPRFRFEKLGSWSWGAGAPKCWYKSTPGNDREKPRPRFRNQTWGTRAGGGLITVDQQQGLLPFDPNGVPGTSSGSPFVTPRPVFAQPIPTFSIVSPFALGNWAGPSGGLLAMFKEPAKDPSDTSTTPSLGPILASSPFPLGIGSAGNQNSSPGLIISTFMPRLPGQAGSNPWGSESLAIKNLLSQIASDEQKVYGITSDLFDPFSPRHQASIANFQSANGVLPMDLVAFIGDSHLVTTANGSFSAGLLLVDAWLIRTPNCDSGLNLGICYDLDTTGPSHNPPCTAGETLNTDGLCYLVIPPCRAGAVQIGGYCFRFPIGPEPEGQDAELRNALLTSARVVFVGSCLTTHVFTDWWNIDLNAPLGKRALVVPDIAAMSSVNSNNGVPPANQGLVDLVQAAVGYESFANALDANENVQKAVDAANAAIANLYPGLTFPTSPGRLPQVVYKVLGNSTWCKYSPACK